MNKPDNECQQETNLWAEEFPIESGEESLVTRRQLTKFLVLTSLGMFAGNLWILAQSLMRKSSQYPEQVIARASELAVGDVKLFNYPEPKDICILIRTTADNFVAYSQKCTHLSCPVYYSGKTKNLECPCHQGAFSAHTGDVLYGPPKRPLPRIELERRGDELVAVAVKVTSE